MREGGAGPVGGSVEDRRTSKSVQEKHRAREGLGTQDIFCLDLAGQRIYLSAADLERVHCDSELAAGGRIGQLEAGGTVGRHCVRIEAEAGARKRPAGGALRKIALLQQI